MTERGLRSLLLACLAAMALPVQAGLFDSDAVLEIRLEGPIDTLVEQKRYPAERPFVLGVEGSEIPVNLRVRGKSRISICDFPPLSLRFGEAGGPPGSLFEGIETLKMVTHCFGFTAGEQDALSEYAVYRILSLLTDYAYRVRLLRITYVDNQGGRNAAGLTRHGFVLEPQDALAARVGGERVHSPTVSLARLDAQEMALVYVFQYLVGNTDWSLVTASADDRCCHNGDLVERDARWFYVAYDFDQAGLVNARYARPDASLGLRNVTQRRYRGFCTDEAVLAGALAQVTARQGEIMAVIDHLPGLDDKARERRRDYLEDFFKAAANPQKLLKEFNRRCLG
jgi:hypothetical protein